MSVCLIINSRPCCLPDHRCADCGQHVPSACDGVDCGEGKNCAMINVPAPHDCPCPCGEGKNCVMINPSSNY